MYILWYVIMYHIVINTTLRNVDNRDMCCMTFYEVLLSILYKVIPEFYKYLKGAVK